MFSGWNNSNNSNPMELNKKKCTRFENTLRCCIHNSNISELVVPRLHPWNHRWSPGDIPLKYSLHSWPFTPQWHWFWFEYQCWAGTTLAKISPQYIQYGFYIGTGGTNMRPHIFINTTPTPKTSKNLKRLPSVTVSGLIGTTGQITLILLISISVEAKLWMWSDPGLLLGWRKWRSEH